MDSVTLPAYEAVDDALGSGGSLVGAAECHGVLCGILCASGASDMQGWVRYLFEERDETRELTADALQVLHNVHQVTLSEINHETLKFSLLLPHEDEPVTTRFTALADWCSGFSLGLSMGGLSEQKLANAEVREFVEDLQHIARTAVAEDIATEDHNDQSLAEIEEYLRMGVLLLNEELQPLKTSPTIH